MAKKRKLFRFLCCFLITKLDCNPVKKRMKNKNKIKSNELVTGTKAGKKKINLDIQLM